jgi:hypothetical protein
MLQTLHPGGKRPRPTEGEINPTTSGSPSTWCSVSYPLSRSAATGRRLTHRGDFPYRFRLRLREERADRSLFLICDINPEQFGMAPRISAGVTRGARNVTTSASMDSMP